MATDSDPFASIFSQTNSRIPEDTVFYAIYPDTSLSNTFTSSYTPSLTLQTLHLEILNLISPITSSYIWQHQPFSLLVSSSSSHLPHLHGTLRFGDNIDDEWFAVYLLFLISNHFPNLSIRVWDNDGEFLLIEAAFHLPRWVHPDNIANRVFVRGGNLHIVPQEKLASPALIDSLKFLIYYENQSVADNYVQQAIKNRISDYPERAKKNTHKVRVRVPVSVAQVLKYEPCLISLGVEGFYDRDIDTMKYAAKMERFLSKGGRGEELVCASVTMSRAMYAQLMQQKFVAPKCYPKMPNRDDMEGFMEAELGMKIACGFEMMYQMRRKEGEEGKGSSWIKYKESLEKSGFFEGFLPGSKEYKRLMEKAEEYYRSSAMFSRISEMMSAPVRRIDEILAIQHSTDDFQNQDVPPSDDDSWLYNGESELSTALQERQKEMDLYNAKHKHKQKLKEPEDAGPSSDADLSDFDLGDIAKTMQAFMDKVSSYKGAEVPENRNMKEVDLDVDQFLKDMESVTKCHGPEDIASDVSEAASSSDMDFDESEDGSDIMEPSEDNEDREDTFMHTYLDALNDELKNTTLKKSFVHANDNTKRNEGTSNAAGEDMDEEFTPVDVDVNLVKSLLDSFSSQQGQAGPTSNLLGLMGLQLPRDNNSKGK
ncbi:SGT1 protein, putative [Ricinus communis]|uniref:SGT1 protein, putative n=1 Tax=Ricinus communis TaxID=3988 RepID=B9T6T9_RICCO|nr:SGT1 protein, putative [Ricinus communis]|eukprot:XP_002533958.1 protein ecdysoneless homolog [Ricinus communis]